MTNNNIINLKRLFNLIEIDVRTHAKTAWIVAAALGLFLLLDTPSNENSFSPFYLVLYVYGFILTSRMFNDLHRPEQANLLLMLPCSNLERFLDKWLLSAIVYPMSILILCYLLSLLPAIIRGSSPLNIIQAEPWIVIGKYIVLQSVVLLGAITFKSHSLIKTALVVGCLFVAFGLFSLLITAILFYPGHMQQAAYMLEASFHGWNFAFWIVLAPICWYITYLRITEYELK